MLWQGMGRDGLREDQKVGAADTRWTRIYTGVAAERTESDGEKKCWLETKSGEDDRTKPAFSGRFRALVLGDVLDPDEIQQVTGID